MTGDDDPPEGVAYQDLPMGSCCMFILDDTRYAQRACGEPPAFAGCSWCEAHRKRVFVRFSRRARPRVQLQAIAA